VSIGTIEVSISTFEMPIWHSGRFVQFQIFAHFGLFSAFSWVWKCTWTCSRVIFI